MEFLYPNMLYGLIALIIPVVVHLFNFRRHKVVYFSNTSILKTIEQESSKTKKLKYLVTMIIRMLFIAALVLAFAFPYRKDNNAVNDNIDNLVAVYIDNSMSMQSHSSEKTLFEDARTSALKMVESLNIAQRYVLLSNDRDSENEYPMNRDEMMMRLNEMKVEAAPVSFGDIYNALSFIKKKNDFETATLFAYSDFQKNTLSFDGLKSDSTIHVVVFPMKSDFQKNIYIDTAWLQSPVLQKNMTNDINARIVNETSDDVKGLPVSFSLGDNMVAYTTCDVKAGSHADVGMQFVVDEDGDVKAKLSIKDSPITFDDVYNMVLKVRPTINVVEINSGSHSPLELLFDGDALVNYHSVDPFNIDRDLLDKAQMIVLNESANLNATMQQSLLDFASRGGILLVLNDENTDNNYIYNEIGIKPGRLDENRIRVEYIARRNFFFDDVFVKLPDNAELPEVRRHLGFEIGKNVLNIVSLQNGNPFIMMSGYGKGRVFVMSTSLSDECSDLADHALFVPLMYKMALIGGNVSDLSYTLDVDKTLGIDDVSMLHDDRMILKDENGIYEIFPLVEKRNNHNYITFFEDLPSSGFYDIYKNEDYVKTVAWNYSRDESEMSFYDSEELGELLKMNGVDVLAMIDADDVKSDEVMAVLVMDSVIWKIFVVLALVALLAEIMVLRFWKS